MANICSVSFNLQFKTKQNKEAFLAGFKQKIIEAGAKHEGVQIAKNKWLFDAYIDDTNDMALSIHGSVRWCLEQESMAEFTAYLKGINVESCECFYEETGCQVYGKYTYKDGELWDCYLDDCHSIWQKANTGEDSYFDALDYALDTEGTAVQVA